MFKLILKMAWKNAFLRVSRTVLVIIMIGVSMSMMLAIQGIYDGMVLNMVDKSKRSDSGEISLYAKEFRVERDIKYSIKNSDEIREEIESYEDVESVVLRLRADGLASTARKSSFASLVGIDLKDEEKFGKFSQFLKRGKIELNKRDAIIGIEIAKTLKLKIGSKLIFSTQDSIAEINSIALKIVGVVQTTNISLDKTAIFVDIKTINKFLSMPKGEVTQIAIRTDNQNIYKKLKIKYNHLEVKTFLELQPLMSMMQDMVVIFNSVTFFIMMIVVFIGIIGVMYVSILDRVREFGIMIGIGMSYRYIRLQIVLESIFIGFTGYILGVILGLIFLVYLKEYGLDLSSFSDAMESWGMESVLYATIKLSYFTTTFVAIMSASVLSVFLPLRKIKHLNPVEVIKSEK
ncbi:MAG: FtsX-like permease family protein [Campylobacterota bacterium]|nr:FtsX-like permease family protein [Campylobacterota bacterium]